MNRDQLYTHLKNESKVLENEQIAHAFAQVDRALFLPSDYEIEAYEDYAVPIGYGSTIPQPTKTAFMLELLEAKEGESVLVVGSGSGWSCTLISHIVGQEGIVVGTEIIPELVQRSRETIAELRRKDSNEYARIDIQRAGSELGAPDKAPFDRIICFAQATELPGSLLAQLAIGGTMVIPIENTLYRIRKTGDFDYEDEQFPDIGFEPLSVSSREE
jgi:protein-L-isoaspartate(D-aspartate) O-methyltransferase